MENYFRKGEKVVCVSDSAYPIQNSQTRVAKHEIVEVRAIRIYPNVGFCVSLKGFSEDLFFQALHFDYPDRGFADEVLKMISIGQK